MSTIIGFIIGFLMGGCIGVVTLACLLADREDDHE